MFSISFLLYLLVLMLIAAYQSPTFGVSSLSPLGAPKDGGHEAGYTAVRGDGAEEYELEQDEVEVDGRGRGGTVRDSFEDEIEGDGRR